MPIPKNVMDKIEKIADRVREDWLMEIESRLERFNVKSPIEQLFLAHWEHVSLFYKRPLDLHLQHPIGIYKVDFLVVGTKRVIELDGHMWHEKTPEQVEKDRIRDRYMQSEGYLITRYTGREILNNGDKLVFNLYEQLMKVEP